MIFTRSFPKLYKKSVVPQSHLVWVLRRQEHRNRLFCADSHSVSPPPQLRFDIAGAVFDAEPRTLVVFVNLWPKFAFKLIHSESGPLSVTNACKLLSAGGTLLSHKNVRNLNIRSRYLIHVWLVPACTTGRTT